MNDAIATAETAAAIGRENAGGGEVGRVSEKKKKKKKKRTRGIYDDLIKDGYVEFSAIRSRNADGYYGWVNDAAASAATPSPAPAPPLAEPGPAAAATPSPAASPSPAPRPPTRGR